MVCLTLRDVSYSYKSRHQTVLALDRVSYDFEYGRFYAVVGKSGCGKSTLLSLLGGLDLPAEGEILYKETSFRSLDRDRYRRLYASLIYQSYNLFPLLSALENVMFPLRLAGMSVTDAKNRASDYLDKVDLTKPQFSRLPGMLSGGEQQRVAIARALSMEADIILADEPTGNLDSENGDNIISLLSCVARDYGRCVIMVTHDGEIRACTDCVINMKDGRFTDS